MDGSHLTCNVDMKASSLRLDPTSHLEVLGLLGFVPPSFALVPGCVTARRL